MLTFSRDGQQVKIAVLVDVPLRVSHLFLCYWDCEDENYAGLLAAEMHDQFSKKIEAVKREAYDRGWRDAKAKRVKETYFYGGL